jgi:hypothetical protein
MPLTADDFVITSPFRSPSAGPADPDFLGQVNLRADEGIVTDATAGATFRATIPTELMTSELGTDNYEVWSDNEGTADQADYHNFVDYVKLYVVNTGDEDAIDPRLSMTGVLKPTDTGVTDIYALYTALGFVDDADYMERSATSVGNDYANSTREGFPSYLFNSSSPTSHLTGTKIADNIARAGVGSNALTGLHKIIRKIDQDSDLYQENKSLRASWVGTPASPFKLYAIGETNRSIVVGLVTPGTDADETLFIDSFTPFSSIYFQKIYGIVAIKSTETITCWNDITKDKLYTPDVDIDIEWKLQSGTTWSNWTTITATPATAFSLTFFDERIVYYGSNQNFIVSSNAYGMHQTRLHTTTHSTILVSEPGDWSVNPSDDQIGYIDFTTPGVDLTDVKLGDRALGVDSLGDVYDLGWVVEIGETPTYNTLTTSIYPQDSADLAPTTFDLIKIIDGTRSRCGFWLRKECECQVTAPPNCVIDAYLRLSST